MNEAMLMLLFAIQGICIIGLGGILWVMSDHQDRTMDEVRELRHKVGL